MKRLSLLALSLFSILVILGSCNDNGNTKNASETVSHEQDASKPVRFFHDTKMSVIQRISDLIMQEMTATF